MPKGIYIRKPLSEEHKKHLSEARKGIPCSEETKKKISEAKMGHLVSEETREKISEGHKGQIPWNKGKTGVYSEETKKKIGEAHKGLPSPKGMLGKHHSEETKKKMSESLSGKNNPMFGRYQSDETRQKLSEVRKGKHYPKLSEAMKGKIVPKGEDNPCWKGGARASHSRRKSKRRSLGFIPQNKFFEGAEAHHLDNERVLFIPKELHGSIKHCLETNKNMEKINTLAVQWWITQVIKTGHQCPKED
jgi:hypothetical protein